MNVCTAACNCGRDNPSETSSDGFASMRTAGREEPPTNVCPTPGIVASFCARMESAASYTCGTVSVSLESARIMIGASAGLILRYVGLLGMFAGSCARAALMAACTSRAAPLMSRLRSNCRMMLVDPCEDVDVI